MVQTHNVIHTSRLELTRLAPAGLGSDHLF